MHDDRKRDPMPPPDATPEEIGEFWDTHSLADYWDETHEVKFQVNLKSDQNQTLSDEKKSDLHTTIPDEASPALGVVTDLVSESILPDPIRRNALKAFDRLCSALIDVPVGTLERRAAEKRAESEARIKIRDEITTQITQQIKVDPEYALRAGHKFAEKIIREQLNLDEISVIAADELKKKQYDNSTGQQADSETENSIDDDWFNIFEKEASQKNSEDMQRRFGRVLAGEIEKPGSYSIKTLKTLGELDQKAAISFKKLCSMCIAFEYLTNKRILDARVISFEGGLVQDVPGKYSLSCYEIDVLREYRLIGSTQNYMYPYNLCIQSLNNMRPQPFRHQGKDWFFDPFDPIQEFRFSGLSFSTVGRELFRIVDQDPMPEYTKVLKKFFADQKLIMVEVPTC